MSIVVTHKDHEMRIGLNGGFDCVQAFKDIYCQISPVGTFGRLVLDFSSVDRVDSAEVFFLLIELGASPQFRSVGISFVNLKLADKAVAI